MGTARILGISAFYHDSAAALVEDGRIVAAAQEERFTRIKGDASFPHHAVSYCLDTLGITEHEVDEVVFYENPLVKFERLLDSYHRTAPFGWKSFTAAMPSWLSGKLWMGREIAAAMGIDRAVLFGDHHLSHAASAFYPSPFEEAVILTIDGVGEYSTTTIGVGRGNAIRLLKHLRFPNSLGLLYSAFTAYTGFKINSGEYKLMGLAPYGKPSYADLIRKELVRIGDDGAVVLNQRYFNFITGLTMTSRRFHDLFGGKPRVPESLITQREMDLAASVQEVVNDAVMKMARHAFEISGGIENLAMAGGVALNVVTTGRLSTDGPFRRIWTQPGAGDAGGAVGAALWRWYGARNNPRRPASPDGMRGAFLGPEIAPRSDVDDALLRRMNASWEMLDDADLTRRIAGAIADGKVVAVARGRMEFGPRALGARSILGDARSDRMQTHMNMKIKFRESFRPFAPMVLAEEAAEWFEIRQESPYMLLVYPVVESRKTIVDRNDLFGIDLLKVRRSEIPAVTHVDYSARVQTVDRDRNPFMWEVLAKFRRLTGCPVIVNTSFNVRGEPIVNTVEDAYRCFMATEIDVLVAGNRWLDRSRQPNRPMNDRERAAWLRRFDLD